VAELGAGGGGDGPVELAQGVGEGAMGANDFPESVVNTTGWFRCRAGGALRFLPRIGKDSGYNGDDGNDMGPKGTGVHAVGPARRKLLETDPNNPWKLPTPEELGLLDFSKPENAIGMKSLSGGDGRRRSIEIPLPTIQEYIPNRRRYPLILKRRMLDKNAVNYNDMSVCKVTALAPDSMKSYNPCCSHVKTNQNDWITVSKKKGRLTMYAPGVGFEPGAFVDAGIVASAVGAKKGTPSHFAIAAAMLDSATPKSSTKASEVDLGESADPTTKMSNSNAIVANLVSAMHPPKGSAGDYPDIEISNYVSASFNQEDLVQGCQIASGWGRRKIHVTLPRKDPTTLMDNVREAKLNFSFMKLTVCKSLIPRTTFDSHCETRKAVLSCEVEYMSFTKPGVYESARSCDREARKAAVAAC